MNNDNVIELGRHKSSVESVISRLNRYQDDIKSITVITQWKKDNSITVAHNEKTSSDLTYEKYVFDSYLREILPQYVLDE